MDSSGNESFEIVRDNCLTNLKILSKIKSGDKLYYYENAFIIDSPALIQPISRWYYAESRTTTVKHLEELLVKLFQTIDHIYSSEVGKETIENNYYARVSKTNIVFKEENSQMLLQFINEMKNAIEGLGNLKQTYKDDISTCSSIDIVIEKLNVRIKKISGVLAISK